jgi:hypothetical protein
MWGIVTKREDERDKVKQMLRQLHFGVVHVYENGWIVVAMEDCEIM